MVQPRRAEALVKFDRVVARLYVIGVVRAKFIADEGVDGGKGAERVGRRRADRRRYRDTMGRRGRWKVDANAARCAMP
jgi:hypothetical protein